MASPTIADFLKFANLQMGAEAVFEFDANKPQALVPGATSTYDVDASIKNFLTTGNLHASRFTPSEAQKFADEWTVVEHKSNTETGFSGTLFKNRQTDELVLSFRSTEFIDDAARDNEATNTQEIRKLGWAFGQISDMEAWYSALRLRQLIPGDKSLAVTGYSLGGHLATAFNLMHGNETLGDGSKRVDKVITFNGAGVGKIGNGNLPAMVEYFGTQRQLADTKSGLESSLSSDLGKSAYRALKAELAAADWAPNLGMLLPLTQIMQAAKTQAETSDYFLLTTALDRATAVYKEARRVPTKPSGATGPDALAYPAAIPDFSADGNRAIAGESVDYQLAVLLTATLYGTSALSLKGSVDGALGDRVVAQGAPLANQYDVAGTETDTGHPYFMVAHSQYRYGQETRLPIEDQPLYRGDALTTVVKESFFNFAVKLLGDNYSQNDFGDTHSLVLIVDSLAVADLFNRLDPAFTIDYFTGLFKAASANQAKSDAGTQGKAEGDVIEVLVDALHKLIVGSDPRLRETPRLNDGDTWADEANRAKFFDKVEALRKAIEAGEASGKGTISSLTGKSASELAGLAKDGDIDARAYRYALKEGNPFVVLGIDYAQHNPNGELDLHDPKTGKGELSEQYLADRARFLTAKLEINVANHMADGDGIHRLTGRDATVRYEDISSDLRIQTVRSMLDGLMQVRFGSGRDEQGGNALIGGDQVDHLYGMAGNDELRGGKKNDFLEGNAGTDKLYGDAGQDTLFGGSGNDLLTGGKDNDLLSGGAGTDTYVFASGDGWDTIEDADGFGSIEYDQIALTGGKKIADKVWKQTDDSGKTFYYLLTDWTENGETFLRLSVQGPDGGLWIKRFQAGQLGVDLPDAPKPPSATLAPTENKFVGDLMPAEYQATLAAGEAYGDDWRNVVIVGEDKDVAGNVIALRVTYNRNDGFGNLIRDPSQADPGRNDIFYDSVGNDLIQGLDGKDKLYATRGGEDRIEAGAGDDLVDASGAGKDLIDAGPGDDIVIAGDAGDVIDGGTGVDHLSGKRGDDAIGGGSGEDVLFGGEGKDQLFADLRGDAALQFESINRQGGVAGRGDWLDGGVGDDTAIGDAADDVLTGGEGRDTLLGGGGDDLLLGDDTALAVERDWSVQRSVDGDTRRYTTSQQIVMSVDFARQDFGDDDILQGGKGNDWIVGKGGNDVIDGGDDDDIATGGAGNDGLQGGSGKDSLYGDDLDTGKPDGLVGALHGRDLLEGGAGDDKLYGDGGADELFGGVGNDELYGDDGTTPVTFHGDDYVDGGEGDDTLNGDGGNDELHGGAGADKLFGDDDAASAASHGNDYLDGGNGNDTLNGCGGNDELFGGAGDDRLEGDSIKAPTGDDYLDGEDGNDVLIGGGGKDRLFGGSGNDQLAGDADDTALADQGSDDLDGGDGDDFLKGYGGDDTLVGGSGKDRLLGDVGRDDLDGGSGDDQLLGGDGNDTLTGGSGTDAMDGGAGDDTYRLEAGDSPFSAFGQVELISDKSGNNTVRFGAGITPATIGVALDSTKKYLMVRYGVDDQVAIEGGGAGSVARFEFADGRRLTFAQLIGQSATSPLTGMSAGGTYFAMGGTGNDVIAAPLGQAAISGGQGNDTILASGGGNTYYYAIGDGTDRISDTGAKTDKLGNPTPNRIRFGAGITPGQIRLSLGSLAIHVDDDPNDVIHIEGFDRYAPLANQTIDLFEFDDGTALTYAQLLDRGFEIDGTGGNDTLGGTAFSDRLVGGLGNDTLTGEAGDDTYVFSRGDGQDTIFDRLSAAGNVNRIEFGADIVQSDLVFARRADGALNIRIADTSDQITIPYWWNANNGSVSRAVQQLVFVDGSRFDTAALDGLAVGPVEGTSGDDYLAGTGLNDTVLGDDGDDVLDTTYGNDLLVGGRGRDTYVFQWQYAGSWERDYFQDTIVETPGEASTIQLQRGMRLELFRGERQNDDLWFHVKGGEQGFLIKGYFLGGQEWNLRSYDGALTRLEDFLARPDPTSGDLLRQAWSDSLALAEYCWRWRYENPNNRERYQLLPDGRYYSSATLAGLYASANATTTYSKEHRLSSDGNYYTTLTQTVGIGATASSGSVSFSETYQGFRLQNAADPHGFFGNPGYLSSNFVSTALFDVQWQQPAFGRTGSLAQGSQYVRPLSYLMDADGNVVVDEDDEPVWLEWAETATYSGSFAASASGTVRSMSSSPSGGVKPADLAKALLTAEVDALKAGSTAGALNVSLPAAVSGTRTQIDTTEFADEYRGSAADDQAYFDTFNPADGGDGNDVMVSNRGGVALAFGGNGNDVIIGGGAKDVVNGGAGDDYLFGDIGGDTYLVVRGQAGHDIVDEAVAHLRVPNPGTVFYWDRNFYGDDAGHTDVVRFGPGIAVGDLRFSYGFLNSRMVDSTDRARLYETLNISWAPGESIHIVLPDKTDPNVAATMAADPGRSFGIELFRFTDGTVLTMDEIKARSLDPAWQAMPELGVPQIIGRPDLLGTASADTLVAANQANYVLGLGGDDAIYGNGKQDYLDGGDGNDTLEGGGGADVLVGGKGVDRLAGGLGDDTYLFARGDGRDTISESSDTTPGNTDTLRFGAGISTADLEITTVDADFRVAVRGSDDAVILAGQASRAEAQGRGIEQIVFADGTIWTAAEIASNAAIRGTDGADTLVGGPGNDTLVGGLGDDTYVFNPGSGIDRIFDTGGNDTVQFGDGIDAGAVTLGLGSLLIRTGIGDDALHIEGFNPDDALANPVIERFRFADGTTLTYSELLARGFDIAGAGALRGTNLDDRLAGSGGADTLRGGDGNDTLSGGAASDLLQGGAGNDRYVFNVGDGSDRIADAQGSDTLFFGSGLTEANLEAERIGDDLAIHVLGGSDFITLESWYRQLDGIYAIEFGDGSALDRSGIDGLRNRPPVANTDLLTAFEDGGALTVPAGALLANDTDPNPGDALSMVSVGSSQLGAWVALVDGQVHYDIGVAFQELAEGEVLKDSFGYTISDSKGALADGRIGVNIVGVNDAPAVAADTAATVEDSPTPVTGNVLANDSDVDAGTVLAVGAPGVSVGEYGALTMAADGGFTYQLDNDARKVQSLGRTAQRVEHFDYVASDGVVGTTATLEVLLNGTNDAPIVVAPLSDQQVDFHKVFSWQLPSDSFADIDAGDALVYTAALADGSELPGWLHFDAQTLVFSGVAPKAELDLNIRVTATDRVAATGSIEGSLSTSEVFVLAVSHGNEGVGNGEDAPPPGQGENFNDGSGAVPGQPGRKANSMTAANSGTAATAATVSVSPANSGAVGTTSDAETGSATTATTTSNSAPAPTLESAATLSAWLSAIDRITVSTSTTGSASGSLSATMSLWNQADSALATHLATAADASLGSQPVRLAPSISPSLATAGDPLATLAANAALESLAGLKEGFKKVA